MRYPTFCEGLSPSTFTELDTSERPEVVIAKEEHADLCRLAVSARSARPMIADLLTEELERARVVPFRELPRSVVSMNAIVEYRHDNLDHVRRVKLVYPAEADIDARRLSVLTSIGVGLIGLSVGASMEFSVRPGSRTRISVLKVIPPDILSAR